MRRSPDTELRLAELDRVGALLWPAGERLREFVLLPSARRPRLLVPRARRAVAAEAVRHLGKPGARALRAGLGWPVIGGRRRLATGEDTIEEYLSDVLGRKVLVTLQVSPPRRANRKPVLQAITPAGALIAYAKVGCDPLTCALVRNERDALRLLADVPLRRVVPPRLLHYGEWRGLDVLVLSPLPVAQARRRVDPALLASAVREIAELGRYAWHGDFSPWNLAQHDESLLVWDWERFDDGLPFGFDLLHHAFQRALRRMSPRAAAEACVTGAARLLCPLGPSSAEARQVAVQYLITLAERHRRDGHEPLGPQSSWLNPVIDHEEALL
ncbi:hypothetical protein [Bailinhaonella thermotolerans]|uniref:hypothetical protein n=1 Tax=Bailinhaonella thermotolerans TaxID=1070861 RepID=UPI001F5B25D7|nr:hypothetical protein [Bailinhaonella thermotolerans]